MPPRRHLGGVTTVSAVVRVTIRPGPLGGAQRVDRHESTGQQRDAGLQSLVVEDRPARQMCHEQRGVLAMRGGRVDCDQFRSRHVGPCAQGQGVGLLFSQSSACSTLTKIRSTRSRVPPSCVPTCQLRMSAVMPPCSASVLSDPFAGLQVLARPSQCQRSDPPPPHRGWSPIHLIMPDGGTHRGLFRGPFASGRAAQATWVGSSTGSAGEQFDHAGGAPRHRGRRRGGVPSVR